MKPNKAAFLLVFLFVFLLVPISQSHAQSSPQVQEISGTLDFPISQDIYAFTDVGVGDTVYIRLEADPTMVPSAFIYQSLEAYLAATDYDFDTGIATLEWGVTTAGPLFLAVSDLYLSASGDYRLVIGINESAVLDGTATPTGDTILEFDPVTSASTEATCAVEYPIGSERTNQFDNTLELNYGYHVYDLQNIPRGGVLYVYVGQRCSNLDTIVEVLRNGTVIAQNDDFDGLNSGLEVELPLAGNYAVRVKSYFNGSQGSYRLRVGVNSPDVLDPTLELDQQAVATFNPETSYTARSEAPVQIITSRFTRSDLGIHSYSLLDIKAGDRLSILMDHGLARIDPYLRLWGPNGETIIEVDDQGGTLNAGFDIQVSQDGVYTLDAIACCGGGLTGRYTLTIGINTPSAASNMLTTTGDVIALAYGGEKITGSPSAPVIVSESLGAYGFHLYRITPDEYRNGDTLYAIAENTSGNGTPLVTLYTHPIDIVPSSLEDFQVWAAGTPVDNNDKATSLETQLFSNQVFYVGVNLAPSDPNDEQTIGAYRLQIGMNRPDLAGEGIAPSSDTKLRPLAIKLDQTQSRTSEPRVIEVMGAFHIEIDDENTYYFAQSDTYTLRHLGAGDHIYANLELLTDEGAYSQLFFDVPDAVYDTFQTTYAFGNQIENATLSYILSNAIDELSMTVHLNNLDIYPEQNTDLNYRLLIGVNASEVLDGTAQPTEVYTDTIVTAVPITVGVDLLQITEVDQKAENFSIIADLKANWVDTLVLFHPADNNGSTVKQFADLDEFNEAYPSLIWPEFVLTNQQSDREIQSQRVSVHSDGRIEYVERFGATLQAPDFDFEKFPFDQQTFRIRFQTLFPEGVYTLASGDYQISGNLGEEEWLVASDDTNATVESINNFSEYTLNLVVNRQRNFYVLRILIPLILIIGIGWAIQFIRDYKDRVVASSGNLLLFVAFNFTIGDDLPRLGYLTFLDLLLLSAFFFAVLVFAFDVGLLRRENVLHDQYKEDDPNFIRLNNRLQRIDEMFVWLYPVVHLVGLLILLQTFGLF